MNWLTEQTYTERMDSEVLPWLESQKESGFIAATADKDGTSPGDLYYEIYTPENPQAALVVCHGLSESVQKYKELIYYFLQYNYQVFLIDHRGHGKSLRQVDNDYAIWVEHFDDYVRDLHRFVRQIVRPRTEKAGLPCYLYGHSMGGCISALYLEQWPQDFSRAILSSPMLAVFTGPVPKPAARLVAANSIRTGKSREPLPGQADNLDGEAFETSVALSRARFNWYLNLRKADSSLRTIATTYGWVSEAISATGRATSAAQASRVEIPVLLFVAGADTLVDPKGAHAFASHAKNVRLVTIPGAKHELYQMEDERLREYYGMMLMFLAAGTPDRFPL